MQPRASDEIELGAATCRCSRTMYWLPSKDRWEYRSRALRITLADAEDGHARDQIDAWVSDYNTTRPHSSLGYPFLPN
ncbi:integrase core domain-containing protein [Paracoccus albus]|uniref:integrase core domain-containing protein n=1 Tax=Paracoccus albus TaxID=3017784 RepID=UPI00336A8B88